MLKSTKRALFRHVLVGLCVSLGVTGSHLAYSDEPVLLTNKSQRQQVGKDREDHQIRYYENAIVDSPMVNKESMILIRNAVTNFLEDGGDIVDFESERSIDFSTLDWTQTYAVYAGLETGTQNIEMDLRLSHTGMTPRIVSVVVEPNNIVRVSRSRTWSPRYGKVSRSAIREYYKLKGVQHGNVQWSSQELAVLSDALRFLNTTEQEYLHGVTLIRDRKSHRGLAASYLFQSRHNSIQQRIHVYDLAFAGQKVGFVGTVSQPHSVAHMVILHEIAHLLCNQPRKRHLQVLNQLTRQHNTLVSEYNQHFNPVLKTQIEAIATEIKQIQNTVDGFGDGPIVESFAAHRTGSRGPTRYADQSMEEAFAESYALFKLDPLALMRTDIGVYQWFSSGEYLELLP